MTQHEIVASIRVKLPAEAKSQAELASSVLAAWRTFVTAAGGEGVTTELRIGPSYEPPARRRRGRPRKVQNGGDPQLAIDAFQAAAGVS